MLLYPPTHIALAALSYGLQKLGKTFGIISTHLWVFSLQAHLLRFQERWRTFSVTMLCGYVKLRVGTQVLKRRWWSINFCFALNRFASSSRPSLSPSHRRVKFNYRQVNPFGEISRVCSLRRNRAVSKLCTISLRRVTDHRSRLIRTMSSTGYHVFICWNKEVNYLRDYCNVGKSWFLGAVNKFRPTAHLNCEWACCAESVSPLICHVFGTSSLPTFTSRRN
jgi:hypothetical protein